MTLGDIIRNYRKEHGLSMEDFAKLCNMSKGYISMLEKNKNPRSGKPIIPSVATYANVASAMNIKTENLMNMVDKDQPVNIAPTTPAGSPAMDSSAPGGTQGSAEGADEGQGGTILMRAQNELDAEDLHQLELMAEHFLKRKLKGK